MSIRPHSVAQLTPRQSLVYRRLGMALTCRWKNPRDPAANRRAAVFRERSGNPPVVLSFQQAGLLNPRVLPETRRYTCSLSARHRGHGADVIRASRVAPCWHRNTCHSSHKGSNTVLAQMPGVLGEDLLTLSSVIDHYALI